MVCACVTVVSELCYSCATARYIASLSVCLLLASHLKREYEVVGRLPREDRPQQHLPLRAAQARLDGEDVAHRAHLCVDEVWMKSTPAVCKVWAC